MAHVSIYCTRGCTFAEKIVYLALLTVYRTCWIFSNFSHLLFESFLVFSEFIISHYSARYHIKPQEEVNLEYLLDYYTVLFSLPLTDFIKILQIHTSLSIMDSNFSGYLVHSALKIAADTSAALKKVPTLTFTMFDCSYISGFSLCSDEIMRTA